MQLTSTTDAATSGRPAGPWPLARLDHPAAASAIALGGWLAFVLARWLVWAHGQITLFIMSGVTYSHPGQMSPRIGHVPLAGYDGQFYYRFARNPFNWHATAYGITIDHNYRYTRLGYPLLTWVLSAGQARAVPVVLIAVNLACVAVIAWLGARFARDAGRHALWGLLFAAYFGLVISVGRDTSEPLADACALGALLAYRRSRPVLAALLLTYGVVTNEPILALAVGIALTRLYAIVVRRRARPGTEDLIWVLPGAVFLVLQVLEKILVTGASGGAADVTANLTLPFRAMVPAIVRDFRLMSWTHLGMYDINLIELIALLAVVVSGLLVLRSTTAPPHERVAFVTFVIIEMVIASGQFWDSVFGDGRTYVDSFLLALVMLVSTPATRVTNRRLAAVTAFAVAALVVVARRRILFQ